MRLRLGQCSLEANQLRLMLTTPSDRKASNDRLRGSQVALGQGAGGGLQLRAHRLQVRADGSLRARYVHGSLCGCSEGTPLVSFGARSARVAGGGRRLHLSWPSLWIGNHRFLTLPYVALPLQRGVSGLLPPRLSYSGRDGLRLSQGVYLVPLDTLDLLLEGGWIQHRGASGAARVRYWWDGRGSGQLQLRVQDDVSRTRGEIRGSAMLGGQRWAVGLAPNLVSDMSYTADLASPADRVFAPYLRSRLWSWIGRGPFFSALSGDLLQDLVTPLHDLHNTRGLLEAYAGLLPLTLLGPLLLDLEARARHWQSFYGGIQPDGAVAGDFSTTALSVRAGVSVAVVMGPLRFSSRGSYQLQSLLGPQTPVVDGEQLLHLGSLAAEISLPLARTYRDSATRRRHLLEPLVGIRWAEGVTPLMHNPDGSSIRHGGHGVVGLRSGLLTRRGSGPVRRPLQAELMLSAPLFGVDHGSGADQLYAGGSLRLRSVGPFDGRLWVNWAMGSNTLTELQGSVCARVGQYLRPCVSYSRLRLSRLDELFGGRSRAWLWGGPELLPLQLTTDQLGGTLRARWRALSLGLQVATDPREGRLTHGKAWLDVTFGCGCYRAGLVGRTRMGQDWPDVALRLELLTGGPGGLCGL